MSFSLTFLLKLSLQHPTSFHTSFSFPPSSTIGAQLTTATPPTAIASPIVNSDRCLQQQPHRLPRCYRSSDHHRPQEPPRESIFTAQPTTTIAKIAIVNRNCRQQQQSRSTDCCPNRAHRILAPCPRCSSLLELPPLISSP